MKNKIVFSVICVFATVGLSACSGLMIPRKENIDINNHQTSHSISIDAIEANGSPTADWSYEGNTGPEYWSKIHSDYSICAKGKEQSPINIDPSLLKESNTSVNMTIQYEPTTFTLKNTRNTIQASPITRRNMLSLNGKEYALEQFHFHTPSEHQFNSKSFPMELHLVHKDPYGKLAVLGIMIHEGNENEKLAPAWNVLPKKESEKAIVKEPIDLNALLPQNKTTFHYNGSLTTPPCTEGVKWVVLEQPIYMSTNQIQAFKDIFPDNHRPVQPINEREISKND